MKNIFCRYRREGGGFEKPLALKAGLRFRFSAISRAVDFEPLRPELEAALSCGWCTPGPARHSGIDINYCYCMGILRAV
ncbi:hypothetical protein ACUSIJ_10470 [Pseudochelatococcus sp. B33]